MEPSGGGSLWNCAKIEKRANWLLADKFVLFFGLTIHHTVVRIILRQIVAENSSQIGIFRFIIPYVEYGVSLSALLHTACQEVLKEKRGVRTVYGRYIGIGGGIKRGVEYERVVDSRNGSKRSRGSFSRAWILRCRDNRISFRDNGICRNSGRLRIVIRADAVFVQMGGIAVMIMIGTEPACIFIIVMSSMRVCSSGMSGSRYGCIRDLHRCDRQRDQERKSQRKYLFCSVFHK